MPAGRLRSGLLSRLALALVASAGPVASLVAQGATRAARLPTPSEHLGIAVGADRVLADWPQVVRYFGTLARLSPAVKLDTLGRTPFGAPMILATISTPENLRRLPAILETQRRLADPRGLSADEATRLQRDQPVIVWINCNLHSTEIGSSQFAMELAHALATDPSLQGALRHVVVALMPSANPDGMQLVVDWYRQGVGTPFEGGPMPWVYHKYVGHDNNRDWYAITQQETKLVTDALYRRWRPNVFWDVHQQGSYGMRLTVPPHVDPINPNVDSRLVRGINLFGHAMAFALEGAGKLGVGDGVTYDLWWHGGARSTPTRHNMIGLLTEAASARIASPLVIAPSELRGQGRQLPRYQRQVNLASAQRAELLATTHAVARDVIARGRNQRWLIPTGQRDPGAAAELVAMLRRGAVEVDSTAGAWVVRLDQPYAAHARDLLETQRWPAFAGDRPYDVAGWTLPFQMGVEAHFDSTGTAQPTARLGSAGGLMVTCTGGTTRPLDDSRAWQWTFDELKAGRPVRVRRIARGAAAAATLVESAAQSAAECRGSGAAGTETTETHVVSRLPRIGVYKPWTASMDEGWTRWLLDERGVPFVSVTDSMIAAGALGRDVDVLVIADMSLREARDGNDPKDVPARYAGGLGTAGLAAIGDFVKNGGRLVTFDNGSEVALAALEGAPIRRVVTPRRPRGDTTSAPAPQGVVAPGSILRTVTSPRHPLMSGMADTVGVYFTNSTAFDVAADAPVSVLMRYHPDPSQLLMSGYIAGGESIAGKAAAVDWRVGRGGSRGGRSSSSTRRCSGCREVRAPLNGE
ncbi:MAG: M14 family metallopeptidase [Gemmatimonadaceae bacterium]|nr:M14 family metallopeptidase [Gemmatimonadaceae bacterium]